MGSILWNHKIVLQINRGGIIYIYKRTLAQTETQSLTYGGVVCLIWYVGFGVLVDGLTDVPTLFMCGSLCRVFDQCVFLFRISCVKRGTIPQSIHGTAHQVMGTRLVPYAYLCVIGLWM